MENQENLVLLLGSNSGNRIEVLNKAISNIHQKLGKILQTSSVYESKAWGFEGNDFLNQIVVVKTDKSSLDCLKITQEIEKHLGRLNKSQNEIYENRLIDIDLLFHGDLVFQNEELTIPHPRIQDRRFTLVPLLELMPLFIHPQLKKSISQLLNDCTDQNEVLKLNE